MHRTKPGRRTSHKKSPSQLSKEYQGLASTAGPFNLKPTIRSVLEAKWINGYADLDRIIKHTKLMYACAKQMEGFKDRIWLSDDNIFRVYDWLFKFITEYSKDNKWDITDSDELEVYYPYELNDDFHGGCIDFYEYIEDKNVRELVKDIFFCLFEYNNIPYGYDSIQMVSEWLEENDENQIENQNAIEDCKIQLNKLSLLLERNTTIEETNKRYEKVKKKITGDLQEFILIGLEIINSDFNFKNFAHIYSESLDPSFSPCFYWSMYNDIYTRDISPYLNEIIGNHGIEDCYYIQSFNGKTQFKQHKHPMMDKLIKLLEISQECYPNQTIPNLFN